LQRTSSGLQFALNLAMILLITPSDRALECAKQIEAATDQPARVAASLSEAVSSLRCDDYTAIVLDECLFDADPEQGEFVLQHAGSATRVYVNCAISGIDRVIRELRAALRRREREETMARKAAEEALRSELREYITAILLDCDLALSVPGLPPNAEEKIRAVYRAARSLGERLQVSELALADA
jgi:hypothetical protein